MKRLPALILALFLLAVIPAQAQTTPPTIIGFEFRFLGIYGGPPIKNGDIVPRGARVAVQLFVICDKAGTTPDINYVVHYHVRHDRVKEPSLYNWETRPAYARVQATCSWQREFGDYSARIDYIGQDTHGPGFDSPLGFNMVEAHHPDINQFGIHVWWCGVEACPAPLNPETPPSKDAEPAPEPTPPPDCGSRPTC